MLNQDIERYYFEMFRKDYPLPDGTIEYQDKPDIVLKGTRKIGIEITNFFLEDGAFSGSEQAQRRRRETTISMAQQMHLHNGGRRFELSFSFDKASPIQDERRLAVSIAQFAKDIEERKTGTVRKDTYKGISEIAFVYLNATEYEAPKWRVMQGHSGQVMSAERLRKIIRTKEERAEFYEPCDAYWLVLIVDFLDRAQDQEIQIDGLGKIDSTIFEKVVIYKTHFGHVVEVK